MKKNITKLLIAVMIIIMAAMLFNMEVTTRQGVNFQVSVIKIPLYLKALDFFDRHYNYKNLVKKIINSSDTEEDKMIKIFKWTSENIRRMPEGYPVIDDHVWHIIVRGYGEDDQCQDVFTTLCNYAGIGAFFDFIYAKGNTRVKSLSFVRLNKKWVVFDVYNGLCFKDKEGGYADIEKLKRGDWQEQLIVGPKKVNIDYRVFFEQIPAINGIGLRRANIQSPLRRLIFQIKQWLNPKTG